MVPAGTEVASGVVASRAAMGVNAADPTAAAHAYLSEFLGMTQEVSVLVLHAQ